MKSDVVLGDQEKFFNINANEKKTNNQPKLFTDFANKEQIEGLKWLKNEKTILDYGVGTGTSIDRFFEVAGVSPEDISFYGVDIAEMAVLEAKKKYPKYKFYKTDGKTMPQILNESVDCVYLLHVLHHSKNHDEIFKEIYRVLKPGGKFLINDLTSKNPLIRFGRFIFALFPNIFGNKFPDDLVVEGKIPDKYPLDTKLLSEQLKNAGFYIQEIKAGHLFFFVFDWLDRVVCLSKYEKIRQIYSALFRFERFLLRFSLFNGLGEMICIKCIKQKHTNFGTLSGDYSSSFNSVVYDSIQEGFEVLDVGCWTGNLGSALINNKNCKVDGIDFRASVLEEARSRGYGETFMVDLNVTPFSLEKNAIKKKYDVIVFADVLEHTMFPNEILKETAKYLKKSGYLIISVPNVAFILNRILLLLGKWDYKEFGTLDKTHLKFFTIASIKKLVEDSGLVVESIFPYNQFGFLRYIEFLKRVFPGLFAYQILVKATLKDE
jgi:2-polyprenyl-3-methyl-5-hydroxy-6-metoxy-1,4-benzoquinol methylase